MKNPASIKAFRLFLLFSCFAVICCYVCIYAPGRLHTEFDDAYMYCRYASNFLQGNGFSWNAVDGPSHGITSPVYLFIVTGLKYCFSSSNSFLLSITSLTAGIAGILVLVAAGFQYRGVLRKYWLPLLIIPFLLVSTLFRYHSFTGMETTLSFLSNSLIVLALFNHTNNKKNSSFAAVCALSVITFLVRPDNGICAVLLPLLFLGATDALTFKKAIVFITVFLGGGILALVANLFLFHSFIPTPFLAKSTDFYVGYAGISNWNPVEYLLHFLRDALPFVCFILFFIRRKNLLVLLSVLTPVAITFVYYFHVVQIMGWFSRYYFPFTPFLVMAAYISVQQRFSEKTHGYRNALFARVFILLVIASVSWVPFFTRNLEGLWASSLDEINRDSGMDYYYLSEGAPPDRIPWWTAIQAVSSLAASLPDGAVIAATEYGFIASENMRITVVDMAGLHDEELVRNGFSSAYILSKHPDLIWMPHEDYTTFNLMLVSDPVFQNEYQFLPGVFNYGIAIWKQSPCMNDILANLQDVFTKTNPDDSPTNHEAVFY